MGSSEKDTGRSAPDPGFHTTQWTRLRAAADQDEERAGRALEELCRDYWYPVYSFVRRAGNPADEAKDLTQSFFEFFLTKKPYLRADPAQGRFRTFLLACLKNHLKATHRNAQAQKRGGGVEFTPLQWDDAEGRYLNEPGHEESPERLYDRNWAVTLMTEAATRLQGECEAAGEGERFRILSPVIQDLRSTSMAELASELGISENGAKSAARRFRQRFRELFEESVGDQLADRKDLAREIQLLLEALR